MLMMNRVLNGYFCVLWRNSCWPAIAPAQPPSTPNASNVASGTLRQALRAAILSTP